MAIDIEKARKLRADGLTHQQVADEMGCSLAWCKANLKGTKQVNEDKSIIDAVRKLGRSKNGVTTGEIKLLIVQQYPNLEGKELTNKVADIKRAAKRDHKDVIVRPYWMLPTEATECTDVLLEYAQEVWQLKEELADKYRKQFDLDSTYRNAVIYALTSLSAGANNNLLPQGLSEYGAQLATIQDVLNIRNGDAIPHNNLVSLDDIMPY